MSFRSSVCASPLGGNSWHVSRAGPGVCPVRSCCRAQKLQPAISPVLVSEEALKYGAELLEPARRGIGSATDLASADDAPSPLQTVPDSDACPEDEFVPAEVPLEQLAAIPACERKSELGSFFDDLSSELKPAGSDILVLLSQPLEQKSPRARRSPRCVVPAEVFASQAEMPVNMPDLPRTITPRPNLPSHRPPKILPHDEWLLQPQSSADVAARLRMGVATHQQSTDPFLHSEAHDWSPQRLVPLIKALTTSGFHANVFELVSFICSTQPETLLQLHLSRRPLTR